jgi:hypothetical protein
LKRLKDGVIAILSGKKLADGTLTSISFVVLTITASSTSTSLSRRELVNASKFRDFPHSLPFDIQ